MAKYSKTFDLPISYQKLWGYCCETAENFVAENSVWKIEKKSNGHIILKKGSFWEKAANAEILVVSTSLEKTLLTITASIFGVALNTIYINGIGEELHEAIIKKWVGEDIEKIKLKAGINAGLICPTCHADIFPGVKFCPNDGTPISKGCKNCGTVNMPSTQFCHNCGKPV